MQVGSVQSGPGSLVIQTAKAAKSNFAYYDPADTNHDGVVSAAEELAYSLSHPLLSFLNTPPSGAASLTTQASRVSQPSASPYHDPADTNQDGTVSGLEAMTYSLKHPGLGGQTASPLGPSATSQSRIQGLPTPYASNGNLGSAHQSPNQFLDLKA